MHRFVKQPAEVVTLAVDFAGVPLGTGEAISAAEVLAAYTADGSDASALLVGGAQISGSQVLQTISGGADGDVVRLTYRATTSEGHVYEEDLTVIVREI